MKIMIEDAIYVQRKDLKSIDFTDDEIPIVVRFEGTLANKTKCNLNEYVKFKDLDAIKFINSLDNIIDYEEYNKLTIPQIKALIKKLEKKAEKQKNEKSISLINNAINNYKEILNIKKENQDYNYMPNLESKEENISISTNSPFVKSFFKSIKKRER